MCLPGYGLPQENESHSEGGAAQRLDNPAEPPLGDAPSRHILDSTVALEIGYAVT